MAHPLEVPALSSWRKNAVRKARLFLVSLLTLLLFGFILLVLWKPELPVPSLLLSGFRKTLAEENLTASFEKLVFSPPNKLIMEKASVHSITDGSKLLEIDFATAEFDLSSGTNGGFSLASLSVNGLGLLSPSLHSAGENNVEPLSDIAFSATHDKEGWMIRHLRFQRSELSVLVTGGPWREIPHAVDLEEKKPWEETLSGFLQELTLWKALLPEIREGLLTVAFTKGDEAPLRAEIGFQAEYIQEGGSGLSFRRPRLHSIISFDTGFLKHPLKVDIFADEITSGNPEAVLEAIEIELLFAELPSEEAPFPQEGRVFIQSASVFDIEGESLHADFRHSEEKNFGFNMRVIHRGGALEGAGEVNLEEQSGRVDLVSNLPLGAFLGSPSVQEFEWSQQITFNAPPELKLSLLAGPGWTVKGGSGELRARNIIAGDVPLDRVHLLADWAPPHLSVSRAVLQQDDFEAEGSYEMNVETQDFRFLLNGSVRPGHIAPWFSSWWSTFWKEFTFHQDPPEGDIDIRGRWNDREKLVIMGSANTRDLQIRGVDIDSLQTRYRIRSDLLDIYDAILERPEGEARGKYQQWVHPETRTWQRAAFSIQSSLDAEAISRMLEGPARSILTPFSFSMPPSISVTGDVYPAPDAEKNQVSFDGETEHPLLYHGFPLEHLLVEGKVHGKQTDLRKIQAGFAGGQVEGNARVDHNLAPDRLRFEGSLREADFEQALAHLIRSRESANQTTPADHRNEAPPASIGGRLDLDLEADGDLDDLLSYEGQGRFSLHDSDLGKIHIFGLLSRLLSNTPLRFTSFHLSEAESVFQVKKDRLSFPRMKITGPSVGLEGQGDYLLAERDLDFRVKVFLLSRSRIPILSLLVLPIMDPLGHLLEVRLGGSLDDPNWRFSIDPRNILDGERAQEREGE